MEEEKKVVKKLDKRKVEIQKGRSERTLSQFQKERKKEA